MRDYGTQNHETSVTIGVIMLCLGMCVTGGKDVDRTPPLISVHWRGSMREKNARNVACMWRGGGGARVVGTKQHWERGC